MKFLIVKKKNLKYIFILVVTLILLVVNINGNSAQVYFGIAPRLVPIYSVDTTDKKVAITFDSAWGADKTLKIIEILKEYDVDATFFLVGFWVEEYPDEFPNCNTIVTCLYQRFGNEIKTYQSCSIGWGTMAKDGCWYFMIIEKPKR